MKPRSCLASDNVHGYPLGVACDAIEFSGKHHPEACDVLALGGCLHHAPLYMCEQRLPDSAGSSESCGEEATTYNEDLDAWFCAPHIPHDQRHDY